MDSRVFLPDGAVLFEYAHLDKDEDGKLVNPKEAMRQLLLIIYQIRNNIVHGGTASFFIRDKLLAERVTSILEQIIEYLLKIQNRDILLAKNE